MFILDGSPVLRDVEDGAVVSLVEPDEELAETLGVGSEPHALCLGADAIAGLVDEGHVDVAIYIIKRCGSVDVLDVVGGVVVHSVEVVGALDELGLLLGPHGKAVAILLLEGLGIVSEVDGVGEPRDGELELALGSGDVLGVFGVPGLSPITCNTLGGVVTVAG